MKFLEFSGIKLLKWFLEHPSEKIHFKELCRKVGLGPLTVKTYCEEFIRYKWVLEERKANLRMFSLNNDHFTVKAIKKAHMLHLFATEGIERIADEGIISLALYGSHANGEYDEKSDLDILAIGRHEQLDKKQLEKIAKKLGKPLQLTIISLDKWEKHKQSDGFMQSVLKNHVVLKGAAL